MNASIDCTAMGLWTAAPVKGKWCWERINIGALVGTVREFAATVLFMAHLLISHYICCVQASHANFLRPFIQIFACWYTYKVQRQSGAPRKKFLIEMGLIRLWLKCVHVLALQCSNENIESDIVYDMNAVQQINCEHDIA